MKTLLDQTRFLAQLSRDFPSLQEVINHVPFMRIPLRKALLVICRCRSVPSNSSLLAQRLGKDLDEPWMFEKETKHSKARWCTLRELAKSIPDLITSTILSDLVSMIVRCIPMNPIEVRDLLYESAQKEVVPAISNTESSHLVFQNLFSIPSRNVFHPIHPKLDAPAEIHSHILTKFFCTKYALRRLTIYPSYSSKTIPSASANELKSLWEIPDSTFTPSTLGLERLYSRTGMMLTGGTEMRTAFKYSDIRPRCYYARGPTVYNASKYVQAVFNVLVDAFESTHRKLRYQIHGLCIKADTVMFIYDYTTFTTKLVDVIDFLRTLADFYHDVEITVIDSMDGPVTLNVGEMLHEYVRICSDKPEFFLSKNIDPDSETEELPSIYHRCGMLGVPGNISSCTLLHGLFLMIVCGRLDVKTVGDDGFGISTEEDYDEIPEILQLLGDAAPEKGQSWRFTAPSHRTAEEMTWHYTKRPISRIETVVVYSPFRIVWPPLPVLFPEMCDSVHTKTNDRYDQHKIASSMTTFVRQYSGLTPNELEYALSQRFLKLVLRACQLTEVDEKGHFCINETLVFPISIQEGISSEAWTDRLIASGAVIRVPKVLSAPVDLGDIRPMIPFESYSSKALKLMVDLEYGKSQAEFVNVLVGDRPEVFQAYLDKSLRMVYSYVIFENIPDWLVHLIRGTYAPVEFIEDMPLNLDFEMDVDSEISY